MRGAVVLALAAVIMARAFRPGVVSRVALVPCVCAVSRASASLGGGAAVWSLVGLTLAQVGTPPH